MLEQIRQSRGQICREDNRGFTIVELLVVIAIFTMLTTITVVNFRGSSPSREVQLQANNVVSLMRQAQVQSLAGEPFNGAFPIGGYGVLVGQCATPPCFVTLFADVDGQFDFDVGEEVQVVSLGRNVTIDSLSTGVLTNVVFKPPRPVTCFDYTCSGIDEMTIVLGSKQSAKKVDILVNQVSGKISS